MSQNSKMLIGAVIAAALAVAVYYGLIGQQQATAIQGQANQTLGTAPVQQPGVPPSSQTSTTQTPAQNTGAPQAPAQPHP